MVRQLSLPTFWTIKLEDVKHAGQQQSTLQSKTWHVASAAPVRVVHMKCAPRSSAGRCILHGRAPALKNRDNGGQMWNIMSRGRAYQGAEKNYVLTHANKTLANLLLQKENERLAERTEPSTERNTKRQRLLDSGLAPRLPSHASSPSSSST